jgi:hypothetical protein
MHQLKVPEVLPVFASAATMLELKQVVPFAVAAN